MVPQEGARADDGPQDSAALPPAGKPGDLGSRLSRRRQDLKLTRRQLAGLAGLSLPYLQDLEAHHVRPTQAALRRLAAALQTTPQMLTGGGTGLPPGRAGPPGQPVLETLTSAECYDLISPGGVGRVAFTTADGPVVLPVNYAMAGRAVIFRTAPDTLLAGYLGCLAGFEVDGLDEALSLGWSVLVTGRAVRVTSEAEVRHLERHAGVRPWAGGARDVYVRIIPHRITGRRIHD
ncbi:MAG TPA: pyridoxamine 5'-phosphate oxidase family protein [Streptosporangiaceae bacterium]|nr:pyridoxamine 5'-phosphate oxidase family protein [Streptosporangiaceae bacterium]